MNVPPGLRTRRQCLGWEPGTRLGFYLRDLQRELSLKLKGSLCAFVKWIRRLRAVFQGFEPGRVIPGAVVTDSNQIDPFISAYERNAKQSDAATEAIKRK